MTIRKKVRLMAWAGIAVGGIGVWYAYGYGSRLVLMNCAIVYGSTLTLACLTLWDSRVKRGIGE